MKLLLLVLVVFLLMFQTDHLIAENGSKTILKDQECHRVNKLIAQEREDGTTITLYSKVHSYTLKIDGQKKKMSGMLYFVEVRDAVEKKSFRVWQEFNGGNVSPQGRIVNPQMVSREFLFSVGEPNKTIGLAYIQGYWIRFHEIDVTSAIIPIEEKLELEEEKPFDAREIRIFDMGTDPSFIHVSDFLEPKFIVPLAENPPRMKSVKRRDGGWEVMISAAGEGLTFLRRKESDTWDLWKQPTEDINE